MCKLAVLVLLAIVSTQAFEIDLQMLLQVEYIIYYIIDRIIIK